MMIAGEHVGIGQRETFAVRNPATGAVLGQLPLATTADLDRALAAAARGFALWRATLPRSAPKCWKAPRA
jgi:succinate-semialdehyde dehydrogenase/glutarate-semialdehyde dehydrogenase